MASATTVISICGCPGCDQPVQSTGPKECGSCGLVKYCCRTCQVEDWPRHKVEECQGYIRKVGMAHLEKAQGFHHKHNWVETLRYSELALVKLKQLKKCPVEAIDAALTCKFYALNVMDRDREALESAKERYCLYLTKHTHPPAILAAFCFIESCIHNKQFTGAELYARTTWETITLSRDSHIPDDQRQLFTADGAYYLAESMLRLAENGDVPPEANQAVAQEAITLARRALEIHTQMHGLENEDVANDLTLLARSLAYFNNVDDVEVLRLYEQSIAISLRMEGSSSVNVGASEYNLGRAYLQRATRASDAYDLDRCMANLELALPHYREAARIYRAINHVDSEDEAAQAIVTVEEALRRFTIARAVAAAAAATNG